MSHKIISFSMVWFCSNDLWAGIISGIGAIFPDLVEGNDYESVRWRRIHRTYTHCLCWWLFFLFFWLIGGYFRFNGFPWEVKGGWFFWGAAVNLSREVIFQVFLYYVVFYFVLGNLLHVLEDAISGKVCLWNPKKRDFGVRLIRVGSVTERIFTVSVFVVIIILHILIK